MIDNKEKYVVGWREWLTLPSLGIDAIKAKIDTGARSSAIHAYSIETELIEGQEFAIFQVHPMQDDISNSITCRAPIVDRRIVRDSGGHEEERLFISTTVEFMGKHWEAEFSLTNRENTQNGEPLKNLPISMDLLRKHRYWGKGEISVVHMNVKGDLR